MSLSLTPHVTLPPSCGLCEDLILEGDSANLFLGSDKPHAAPALTRLFNYPSPVLSSYKVNGLRLCYGRSCKLCAASPECAAVHHHCFIVYVKQCRLALQDALDSIRTIVLYRHPWAKFPLLDLRSSSRAYNFLADIAEESDLARLRSLPNEILHIIRLLSPDAWLWRTQKVFALAHQPRQISKIQALPLQNIAKWRVERLQQWPGSVPQNSKRQAFVIEPAANLRGIEAQIKNGLLRLHLSPSQKNLTVRDTPNPPQLSDCYFAKMLRQKQQYLQVVNLANIQGLTFFYLDRSIYGVYAHTCIRDYAIFIRKRFPFIRQEYFFWIYIPISSYDEIITVGFRLYKKEGGCSVMIRTKHSGDTIIGPQSCGRFVDLCYTQPSALLVRHSLTPPYNHWPVDLGVYTSRRVNDHEPRPFSRIPSPPVKVYNTTYFSSAPTCGILKAYVFEDNTTGFCRGILFEYEGYIRRAVGQCRLGVDRSKEYKMPSFIYICSFTTILDLQRFNKLEIRFGSQPGLPQGDNENWEGWRLGPGSIHFWFSKYDDIMRICC
ncbi:hypothetical protein BD289DRAFT_137376 [Coniella lustricola]|uniref:Uncharacterized protein n=1 Tax=Coniella lustricola TaxID=2025994 RepID=A0A2T2ZVL6_9PEZI|nr:hypothetical protein BD289DRAFT_137376 [Coniella lustricola]